MKPYYTDDWLTLYGGDCREVLASLPADSVDCVVTSPPYWGLRDYGTEGQLGLERTPEEYVANMVAVFREVRRVLKPSGTCWLNLGDSYSGSGKGGNPEGSEWKGYVGNAQREEAITKTAGEKRIPAGLKPKDLVGIPWRVAFALQADGWYLRSEIIWSKPNPMPESVTDRPTKSHEQLFLLTKSARYFFDQEAVRERVQPTGSSARSRSEAGVAATLSAIREGSGSPASLLGDTGGADEEARGRASVLLHRQGEGRAAAIPNEREGQSQLGEGSPQASSGHADREHSNGRGVGDDQGVGSLPVLRTGEAADDGPSRTDLERRTAHSGERGSRVSELQQQAGQPGRNLRSVWTIATRPYPGAHFAVFPPELPERCIKAGSSERGVCPECGAPWERTTERGEPVLHHWAPGTQSKRRGNGKTSSVLETGTIRPRETTGWIPTCDHLQCSCQWEGGGWPDFPHKPDCPVVGYQTSPAVILDPFGGSGTVGMVANRLSRRAILIDLNPEYLEQQMTRNAQTPLGLTEGDAA